MIIGYVGTPGSGKSYEAVKKIVDNLKTGRIVCTNIDGMQGEKQREAIKCVAGLSDSQLDFQLHVFDDKKIREFWLHVIEYPGCLVVIDEVHKLFSNRDWQTDKNKQFTEWSSTHRHGGYDVLLITQDIEKVDKHERSLIEWTYFFRKINYFGNMVSLKYRRFSYDSDDHQGKPISEDTFTYDTSIFACYSSYDSSGTKELGIQKNVNVLRHPIFYSIPVVLIIFGYFFSQSSLMSGDVLGSQAIQDNLTKASTEMRQEAGLVSGSAVASPPSVSRGANMVIMYKMSNGDTHITNGVPPIFPGLTIIKQTALTSKLRTVEKTENTKT